MLSQKSLQNLNYGSINSKEFVHYTSLDALYGILNSGDIRLYDLNNMNDPYEFNYIIKKLGLPINQEQIDFFKSSLFITSLCEYDQDTKDDFDMWRLYGKDGKGVAIVYEILNFNENWFNFLIGKVQYGSNNSESEKLHKAIDVFNHFIKDKGMKLERIPQLFGFLLMLHKNEIWKSEREFRLVTHMSYDFWTLNPEYFLNPLIEETLSFFLQPSGKQAAFVSIPLNFKIEKVIKERFPDEEDQKKAFRTIPQIKIKKVIAGYALPSKFTDELSQFCWKMIRKWRTDWITIQQSHLAEWFK